jgi:hypothetical protein
MGRHEAAETASRNGGVIKPAVRATKMRFACSGVPIRLFSEVFSGIGR